MRMLILVISLILNNLSSNLQQETGDLLFMIERNRDRNAIHYVLNLDESGELNKDNPIKTYWKKNAEDGRTESLTLIQQKLAYGLKFIQTDTLPIEFQFVSYKKRSLFLDKNEEGLFRVFTFAGENDDLAELNRIYIQIDGGSFWFPSVTRIELLVLFPDCMMEYSEIVIP